MAEPTAPILKLTLLKDWDIPVNLPISGEATRGHFAGRNFELAALTNEFVRRTNGAILVSGHRGAGKTSLVHRALNDARRRNQRILPILVNAGHLRGNGAESIQPNKSQVDPKALIEAIVRRLYSTAQATAEASTREASPETIGAKPFPTSLLEPIDNLYRKCVAAEFKLVESITANAEHSRSDFREETSEQKVKVGELLETVTKIGWAVAGMTAVAPWIPSAPARSATALLVAGFPYAASVAIKRKRTTSQTSAAKLSAEELYHFDSKVGNLEFDLEIIHRKALTMGWKLVYVIDELDKLEPDDVRAIIEVCKNLFTLSDAVFVFLGDERLYRIGETKDAKVYVRGKEYTYFNSRYYIGPPTTDDLEEFLTEVVQVNSDAESLLSTLRYCLFFEARNDFFDLVTAVRGRITGFDGDCPVISITKDGLSEEDIQKARFCICIASLCDKYMSTSVTKWRQNAELVEVAFTHALMFFKKPAPTEVFVPSGHSAQDELLRDFNRLLFKLGALNEMIRRQNQQGPQGGVNVYPVTGGISVDPARKLNMRTEFEEKYLAVCDQFFEYMVATVNIWQRKIRQPEFTLEDVSKDHKPICDIIQNWGFDPRTVLNKHLPRYKTLRNSPPPYDERKDKVAEATDNITSGIDTFCVNLPVVLGKMIVALIPSGEFSHIIYQGHGVALTSGTASLRNAFGSRRPSVVFNADGTKQVVILIDVANELTLMEKELPPADSCRIIYISRKSSETLPKGVFVVKCSDAQELLKSTEDAIEGVLKFLKKARATI
jgi:AAA ATPase domain